jgi:hypothetical protein
MEETVDTASTEYVLTADQVLQERRGFTAVLDGEARTELLAVPTCGGQRPYPVAIWIDADARVVRLRRNVPARSTHLVDRRTMSPHSTVTTIHDVPMTEEDNTRFQEEDVISESRVVQALRSAAAGHPPKDRIMQAVLLKWKVIME